MTKFGGETNYLPAFFFPSSALFLSFSFTFQFILVLFKITAAAIVIGNIYEC